MADGSITQPILVVRGRAPKTAADDHAVALARPRSDREPLCVGLSLLFVWTGLAVTYYSRFPVGFLITAFAFTAYLLTRILGGRAPAGRYALPVDLRSPGPRPLEAHSS